MMINFINLKWNPIPNLSLKASPITIPSKSSITLEKNVKTTNSPLPQKEGALK